MFFYWEISAVFFFFSSRRRHTGLQGDWSSDVCSSDLTDRHLGAAAAERRARPRTCSGDAVVAAAVALRIPAEVEHARVGAVALARRDAAQIGRASCRERG